MAELKMPMLDLQTPILDTLHLPKDLRNLASSKLGPLAKELRHEMIDAVSCLLYTSPSPRDGLLSRMPSSA